MRQKRFRAFAKATATAEVQRIADVFRALRKAHGLIGKLHEDLQFDYLKELEFLVQAPEKTSAAKKIISYFQKKKYAKIKEKKTPS